VGRLEEGAPGGGRFGRQMANGRGEGALHCQKDFQKKKRMRWLWIFMDQCLGGRAGQQQAKRGKKKTKGSDRNCLEDE